jgi:hypothetical protein
MLCMRTLFSVALLVPFLATSLPARAAKMDLRAARAECFRKANDAANAAARDMTSGPIRERQAIASAVKKWAYRHNDSIMN